jgi:ADP-heptose:LPS heptosyltransferase
MNKLTIRRVEQSKIYFVCSESLKANLQLFIDDKAEYACILALNPKEEYYIGHPKIVPYSASKLVLTAGELTEIYPLDKFLNKGPKIKEGVSKKVLVTVACPALGDTLCASPTIRKISQAYGHPVSVQTHRPDLFERCPYIDQLYDFSVNVESQYEEIFETYNQWIKLNQGLANDKFRQKPMEIKLHNFEARQLHALGVGLHLYPSELHCDFFPAEQTTISKQVDKTWVVFHTTKSWENRTWPDEHWERLLCLIKDNTELKVALIGRSHKETSYQGDMQKNVVHLQDVELDLCVDGGKYQGQPDEGAINEMWHVINNSLALISFDSGPVHLAGTTDSHIVQIGASIDPQKTAPWRKGSQQYKFHFVGGECKRFCGSDPKYSVQEWKTINMIPYTPTCLERLDKYYCQPTPYQVFIKLLDILAL